MEKKKKKVTCILSDSSGSFLAISSAVKPSCNVVFSLVILPLPLFQQNSKRENKYKMQSRRQINAYYYYVKSLLWSQFKPPKNDYKYLISFKRKKKKIQVIVIVGFVASVKYLIVSPSLSSKPAKSKICRNDHLPTKVCYFLLEQQRQKYK